jgi:hypothetical protein
MPDDGGDADREGIGSPTAVREDECEAENDEVMGSTAVPGCFRPSIRR